MTPTELLNRLEAEGIVLSLNLKLEAVERPSEETRTLVRENRDALLEHLARTRYPVGSGLHLYGDLLHSLMRWVGCHYELRLEHPGGVILNAKPEQAAQHLAHSAWAVLYDETKTILATSGNVPRWALTGKTELQPTATAQAPVTAEKVVN